MNTLDALRLAFMGTPDFAVPSLSALVSAGHDIAAVYTRAPKPAGRGQASRKSPVHELAEGLGLAVRTPATLKDVGEQQAFAALHLDVAVVVAYGHLLPKAILVAPRLGCVNVHASLLPRWRGAAPIARAIMAGDTATGVTLMAMDEGLDTGAILLSETVPITTDTTAGALSQTLARVGAELLPRGLSALARGVVTATAQPTTGITYAAKIDKAETKIDWTRPAHELDRFVRALSPAPGAWFRVTTDGKDVRVKVLSARVIAKSGRPGTLLERLTVACGNDALALVDVQREGKKPMSADEFLRGLTVAPGTSLG